MSKLKSTVEGLIYIKHSIVLTIRRANSIEAAKVLGKPVIVNCDQISFLTHNPDGNVTFFMTNGFEIALNVMYDEAEKIFNCAKSRVPFEVV